MERGNIVFLSVALIMLFVDMYDSDKKYERVIAIIALGLSASIKIYPALFGLLLVRKRMWKEAVLAVIVGLILMFAPFIVFDEDNRSITLWISNIINCSNHFQNVGLGFKLNLSNMIHIVEAYLGVNISKVSDFIRMLVLLTNCAIVVIDTKMEEWKASALLSLVIILVPGFSWTYTMLLIFIPVILFLEESNHPKEDFFFLVAFIIALSFVPISNQFGAFSLLNVEGTVYRFGWTTLVESISLIMLEVGIIVDRIRKYAGRNRIEENVQ